MRTLVLPFVLALTACGGGGGSTTTPAAAPTVTALSVATQYQNADSVAEVFNTAIVDLNGDGRLDIVVSGWANEPATYTNAVHGKIPVKILIQQTDGSMQDQTSTWLPNNMIYGTQRILVGDFDGDGKPDVFLGGFQDSPNLGLALCCNAVNSVMLWNEGTSFTRYDFADSVWAHAVCAGDLEGTGRLDIVVGAGAGSNNTIYSNQGNRNFLITHIPNYSFGDAGTCSIIHDPASGNSGIVISNEGAGLIAGYNGAVVVVDTALAVQTLVPLTGTEAPAGTITHDIENIVQIDLNGDGQLDLVLTDNRTDQGNGSFTALINTGGFNFANATSTYFPTQTDNYYFQYYTESLNINGNPAIVVDNVDSNWNFSTLPQLWVFANSSFQPANHAQLTADIANYIQPTLYTDSSGTIHLLLIQQNLNSFTFYTRSL